jgi:two-component system, NarL family, nitrate/nitrite response regulator NarL
MRHVVRAAPHHFSPQEGCGGPRLLMLSDVRLLRDGLALAMASLRGVRIAGTTDIDAPIDAIARCEPDVLLIDAGGHHALEAARRLRAELPDVRIVAFGIEDGDDAIMAWAEAGAAGFVAPSASAEEVVAIVHDALRGELVCSPRAAGLLLNRLRALAAPRAGGGSDRNPLTQREQEIASMMGEGLSNKQIARRLGIQSATVKNHVHSILAKLNLNRRGEVAAQLDPQRSGCAGGGLSIVRDVHVESLAAA